MSSFVCHIRFKHLHKTSSINPQSWIVQRNLALTSWVTDFLTTNLNWMTFIYSSSKLSHNWLYHASLPPLLYFNVQAALAQALWTDIKRMDDPECYFNSLPKELEVKRDRMVRLLNSVGLKPIIPDGGYFIIADVSSLGLWSLCYFTSTDMYVWKESRDIWGKGAWARMHFISRRDDFNNFNNSLSLQNFYLNFHSW